MVKYLGTGKMQWNPRESFCRSRYSMHLYVYNIYNIVSVIYSHLIYILIFNKTYAVELRNR